MKAQYQSKEQVPFKGHAQDGAGFPMAPADFTMGSTVSSCEASVRQGFLRKVFGLVATQLAITAGMCALAMYEPNTQAFILGSPQLLVLSMVASFGEQHPCSHTHSPIADSMHTQCSPPRLPLCGSMLQGPAPHQPLPHPRLHGEPRVGRGCHVRPLPAARPRPGGAGGRWADRLRDRRANRIHAALQGRLLLPWRGPRRGAVGAHSRGPRRVAHGPLVDALCTLGRPTLLPPFSPPSHATSRHLTPSHAIWRLPTPSHRWAARLSSPCTLCTTCTRSPSASPPMNTSTPPSASTSTLSTYSYISYGSSPRCSRATSDAQKGCVPCVPMDE